MLALLYVSSSACCKVALGMKLWNAMSSTGPRTFCGLGTSSQPERRVWSHSCISCTAGPVKEGFRFSGLSPGEQRKDALANVLETGAAVCMCVCQRVRSLWSFRDAFGNSERDSSFYTSRCGLNEGHGWCLIERGAT